MPTQPQDGADRRTQRAADRTVLAAERTYAAWVRTGLAALASGVGAKALLEGVIVQWLVIATGKLLVRRLTARHSLATLPAPQPAGERGIQMTQAVSVGEVMVELQREPDGRF